MKRRRCGLWMAAGVLVVALALAAGAAGAGQGAPEFPIIGPTSWSDSLEDMAGLSWLEDAQLGNGQVNLSRMEPLSGEVGGIVSLAEGPDQVFYLGNDEARLWSWDAATGITTDLGFPVPGECDN